MAQLTKAEARELQLPKGWVFTSLPTSTEPFYTFQTGSCATGFKECRATQADVEDGSHIFMMENGFTR